MDRWSMEQLERMDDLTFAITILNEHRSRIKPDSPLGVKLYEAVHTLAEYKHIDLAPEQSVAQQQENLKLTTQNAIRQRQLEIIAERAEIHGGIDHLVALDEIAKEGWIVILPCPVGGRLYRPAGGHTQGYEISEYVVCREYILKGKIGIFAHWIKPDGNPATSCEYFTDADIGRKVFLSREEAEEADRKRFREAAEKRALW